MDGTCLTKKGRKHHLGFSSLLGACYKITGSILGRAPASQGRSITGFASLGASHASPLHAPHAKPISISQKIALFLFLFTFTTPLCAQDSLNYYADNETNSLAAPSKYLKLFYANDLLNAADFMIFENKFCIHDPQNLCLHVFSKSTKTSLGVIKYADIKKLKQIQTIYEDNTRKSVFRSLNTRSIPSDGSTFWLGQVEYKRKGITNVFVHCKADSVFIENNQIGLEDNKFNITASVWQFNNQHFAHFGGEAYTTNSKYEVPYLIPDRFVNLPNNTIIRQRMNLGFYKNYDLTIDEKSKNYVLLDNYTNCIFYINNNMQVVDSMKTPQDFNLFKDRKTGKIYGIESRKKRLIVNEIKEQAIKKIIVLGFQKPIRIKQIEDNKLYLSAKATLNQVEFIYSIDLNEIKSDSIFLDDNLVKRATTHNLRNSTEHASSIKKRQDKLPELKDLVVLDSVNCSSKPKTVLKHHDAEALLNAFYQAIKLELYQNVFFQLIAYPSESEAEDMCENLFEHQKKMKSELLEMEQLKSILKEVLNNWSKSSTNFIKKDFVEFSHPALIENLTLVTLNQKWYILFEK